MFDEDDYARKRLVEMADGSLVERDTLNIVDKIREYDYNLVLKFCAQSDGISDAPYRLYEKCPDGLERMVFEIWELDERVIDRLRAADNAVNNVFVDVEGHNLIVKQTQEQRYKERLAEGEDVLASYLKSPKGTFSFYNDNNQLVTIDDQEGRRAKVG